MIIFFFQEYRFIVALKKREYINISGCKFKQSKLLSTIFEMPMHSKPELAINPYYSAVKKQAPPLDWVFAELVELRGLKERLFSRGASF